MSTRHKNKFSKLNNLVNFCHIGKILFENWLILVTFGDFEGKSSKISFDKENNSNSKSKHRKRKTAREFVTWQTGILINFKS